MYIDDKKFLIVTEPKTIHFDLPIEVKNCLKHEIKFFIKDNEFLAEQRMKS